MKQLRRTMEALKLSDSVESREQQKILAASVTNLEFGVPDLGLNLYTEKKVIEMKRKLIDGETSILKTPANTVREVFPPEVKKVAISYWKNITITEPAKQRYPSKVVPDGKEISPTRYQTMTNDETYQAFSEGCRLEIKRIMESFARQKVSVYSQQLENKNKQYRLKYAEKSLPDKFPSFSWWMEQRPTEVKPLHDHTTGLCKVIIG